MKGVLSFLFYTFAIVVNARASDPFLLNGKIKHGAPATAPSSTCVVSFRHNGTHQCSGVYAAEFTITTSMMCGDKLLELMSTSRSPITAVSSETGREIEKVKPLYVPKYGPVDIALVLAGHNIFGSPSGSYLQYSSVIILPECDYDVFGWGKTKVPMVKDSQIGLMAIKVITLEIPECNGISDGNIDTTYYMCAKTVNDHQKITESDVGSPLILLGAIAGVISSHIHDSGNYFYFIPSVKIIEILRVANVDNIWNFFPNPKSEPRKDPELHLTL